ncbi:MAG: hypothetical protein PHP03_00205 [Candidatus Pacebacteria bacterium]|nr:hypothetical protein [Candidatus Paceibacterota bacterium]
MKIFNVSGRSGQAMLLTILMLSGTIIGAVAIGGYMMISQIRQSTDVINSAKAIFAADAGLEWRLYKFSKDGQECKECPAGEACPAPTLNNSASVKTSCVEQGGNKVIKSTGSSNKIYRAFGAVVGGAAP